MKRFALFLVVFSAVFLTSCPYYGGPCRGIKERNKEAIVYLHVLKDDGTPLEDSYANNFILDYCAKDSDRSIKTIINENDALIFECSRFDVYFEGDEPTEPEMKKTLDNDYWFALKDKTGFYKTVRKTYKETYKSYEENKNPGYGYYSVSYIYHCEVKLEKK